MLNFGDGDGVGNCAALIFYGAIKVYSSPFHHGVIKKRSVITTTLSFTYFTSEVLDD